MAKCKNCHKRGFTVETDVNGLCQDCSPYYYLTMEQDLKGLNLAVRAIERINQPDAAMARIKLARKLLEKLRPYASAGLAVLPMPQASLEEFLAAQEEYWSQ